jgi:ligand-binding SRPBCC domain-containing protein
MKRYILRRTQCLPVSMEQAWLFFSSPLNLPLITPPWLNLSPVDSVPEKMFPGMIIRYRVTPLPGLAVTWISEITRVDPPRYFVDRQRCGPYRFWHHQHRFRPVRGGVEMIDKVTYGLKCDLFAKLIHSYFVGPRLEAIFNYRFRALEKIFTTDRVRATR